ncbi:hypothetical protein TNIN_141611 [Trichonephila inaurata madagascariensis]|uniref:Uncharacterized protein n=1 Tax=Trichonephila inaurata madagascariensis TaxID=2747483 RepID=A0A8X6Y8L4_9ARAC|nr:hypothetical protein TNIN_141611 [Trichonephila inaurata madagascariensis]
MVHHLFALPSTSNSTFGRVNYQSPLIRCPTRSPTTPSQYACKRNIVFYHKVVEAVIAILSGTAPCLIVENPTQQLRKGALDLVSYIVAKRLKLLQPDLLQRFFNVLICLYDEDNEDNFLLGLKIILDVFKSESLPEVLMGLCQRLLLVFKYKVTDVNIRESRTSYASVKLRHRWKGKKMVTLLPVASESLCVIAEAPELILLTLPLWSTGSFYFGIVNDMSNVFLKIINFLPDEESRCTHNFNLDTFTIILKMQINILHLLAHIYRIHLSLEENCRTEEFAIHFFSGLIHLLKNCPANSEFLREKY